MNDDQILFEKLREWKFKLSVYLFFSFYIAQMNQALPDIAFPPELEGKAIILHDKMSRLLKSMNNI